MNSTLQISSVLPSAHPSLYSFRHRSVSKSKSPPSSKHRPKYRRTKRSKPSHDAPILPHHNLPTHHRSFSGTSLALQQLRLRLSTIASSSTNDDDTSVCSSSSSNSVSSSTHPDASISFDMILSTHPSYLMNALMNASSIC